jgi:hypothetical protein
MIWYGNHFVIRVDSIGYGTVIILFSELDFSHLIITF